MRKVCLLGASGSIGTQSLDVLRNDAGHFRLVGFSVGHQVQKIPSILHDFPSVKFLCVQEEKDYERYSRSYPNLHWYYGEEGLLCLIRECGCDMVVNALVGFAGLAPSLCSLEENKILCLANKESLVVGGDLIRDLIAQGKGKILSMWRLPNCFLGFNEKTWMKFGLRGAGVPSERKSEKN